MGSSFFAENSGKCCDAQGDGPQGARERTQPGHDRAAAQHGRARVQRGQHAAASTPCARQAHGERTGGAGQGRGNARRQHACRSERADSAGEAGDVADAAQGGGALPRLSRARQAQHAGDALRDWIDDGRDNRPQHHRLEHVDDRVAQVLGEVFAGLEAPEKRIRQALIDAVSGFLPFVFGSLGSVHGGVLHALGAQQCVALFESFNLRRQRDFNAGLRAGDGALALKLCQRGLFRQDEDVIALLQNQRLLLSAQADQLDFFAQCVVLRLQPIGCALHGLDGLDALCCGFGVGFGEGDICHRFVFCERHGEWLLLDQIIDVSDVLRFSNVALGSLLLRCREFAVIRA